MMKRRGSKEDRWVKGEEERSRRWVTSNKDDLQQGQWTSGGPVDQEHCNSLRHGVQCDNSHNTVLQAKLFNNDESCPIVTMQ